MKKQLQPTTARRILFVIFIFLFATKLFAQDQLYTAIRDYGIKTIFEVKTYKNGFNISCNGNTDGNVIVTVVGGTYPFRYSWNRGDTTQNISNVAAGIYTLTVTDADGHQDVEQVELKQPDVFDALLIPSIYIGDYNISNIGGNDGVIKAEIKG